MIIERFGVTMLALLFFFLVSYPEKPNPYLRKSVLLAALFTVFTTFLLWGSFLEYTLWVEDGIIDRLRKSDLPNSEVRGWILSLNLSFPVLAYAACVMSGIRIYQLLARK